MTPILYKWRTIKMRQRRRLSKVYRLPLIKDCVDPIIFEVEPGESTVPIERRNTRKYTRKRY
jgi:hypothetical protein